MFSSKRARGEAQSVEITVTNLLQTGNGWKIVTCHREKTNRCSPASARGGARSNQPKTPAQARFVLEVDKHPPLLPLSSSSFDRLKTMFDPDYILYLPTTIIPALFRTCNTCSRRHGASSRCSPASSPN